MGASLIPSPNGLQSNIHCHNVQSIPFGKRVQYTNNTIAQRLFSLMEEKQTNLCLAADVTTKKELLELADCCGSEICMIKTHIDIIHDFDDDLIVQLKTLAKKHNFLIMEDRKFCDIGSTAQKQFTSGIYKIADWANLVTAHAISGSGIIQIVNHKHAQKKHAIVLIASMSSANNLIDENYTQTVMQLAEANIDCVLGFITQQAQSMHPGLINITPGVHMHDATDTKDQQYNTPEQCILEKGTDIIIVGRGIYQSPDPYATANKYRSTGWRAYMQRINKKL